MNERPEITVLDSDFSFNTGSERERITAPVNKLLKFHTLPMEQTTRVNTYKTLPNGDPNPNFGKEETVLIFKAELDESDAKGQWYSAWVSPAVSERSKLGKISEALFGSVDAIKEKTAADVANQPFQCALKNYETKTGEERQTLNLDKIMPAAEGQTAPGADVVLDDLIDDNELDAALAAAENAK